jgi:hypothetical protein
VVTKFDYCGLLIPSGSLMWSRATPRPHSHHKETTARDNFQVFYFQGNGIFNQDGRSKKAGLLSSRTVVHGMCWQDWHTDMYQDRLDSVPPLKAKLTNLEPRRQCRQLMHSSPSRIAPTLHEGSKGARQCGLSANPLTLHLTGTSIPNL